MARIWKDEKLIYPYLLLCELFHSPIDRRQNHQRYLINMSTEWRITEEERRAKENRLKQQGKILNDDTLKIVSLGDELSRIEPNQNRYTKILDASVMNSDSNEIGASNSENFGREEIRRIRRCVEISMALYAYPMYTYIPLLFGFGFGWLKVF